MKPFSLLHFHNIHYRLLNKSASYYILKPIDIQELILAVNKVTESLEKKKMNSTGIKSFLKT